MTDFPQGAVAALRGTYGKSSQDRILGKLKRMSFQDIEELTEWLLDTPGEDPIRPRTDSECRAYVMGFITCLELAATAGLRKAYEEAKMMAETEDHLAQRKRERASK